MVAFTTFTSISSILHLYNVKAGSRGIASQPPAGKDLPIQVLDFRFQPRPVYLPVSLHLCHDCTDMLTIPTKLIALAVAANVIVVIAVDDYFIRHTRG
jgi:hypothetical protein